MERGRAGGWIVLTVLAVAAVASPLALGGRGKTRDLSTGWHRSALDVIALGRPHLQVLPQGVFLRIDEYGGCCDSVLEVLRSTDDGRTWTLTLTSRADGDFFSGMRDVAPFGDELVGVGDWSELVGDGVDARPSTPVAATWTSPDGMRWRPARRPATDTTASMLTVDRLGDVLVSTGHVIEDDESWAAMPMVWTSGDAVRWRPEPDGAVATAGLVRAFSVDGRLVVLGVDGDDVVSASTIDGEEWLRRRVGTLRAHPFDAPEWLVAVGRESAAALAVYEDVDHRSHAELWSTSDGRTWSRCDADLDGSVTALARTGDALVAVGGTVGASRMWTSDDGCLWNELDAPPARDADLLYDVAVTDGGTVVVIAGIDTGDPSNKGPVYDIFSWTWQGSRPRR